MGQTPLQALDLLRKEHLELSNARLAYAGRLDPMAHGDLLVLIDDECQKRDEYQLFNKEYIFSFVLGISTDTYDLFGEITQESITKSKNILVEEIQSLVNSYRGTRMQELPPYSSHRVNGKPLLWWASQNKLDEIELPTKEVEIFSNQLVYIRNQTLNNIKQKIEFLLSNIKGDFRYDRIKQSWESLFTKHGMSTELQCICVRMQVSSGTYIRSIVHEIGKELGCGAVATSIYRSKIEGN